MTFALVYGHTTDCAVYHAGCAAYYDTMFSGLVPVRVVEVVEPGYGWQVAPSGRLRVVVSRNHGAYHAGQEFTLAIHNIVPGAQLRRHQFTYTVNTDYRFE